MFTAAFEDYKEDEDYFCSVAFGIDRIKEIKEFGHKDVAKMLKGLVLEKPYIDLYCFNCQSNEKYTIDDLVTENEQPNYKGKFVICINCNKLISLI